MRVPEKIKAPRRKAVRGSLLMHRQRECAGRKYTHDHIHISLGRV